jgi:signal transduction histidine kinase/CheY-like chemotaxis protein
MPFLQRVVDSIRHAQKLLDDDSFSLLQSTSRTAILTTGAVYGAFHIIATLFWTRIFSPPIWIVTAIMAVTIILSLWVMRRVFFLSHAIWFVGLAAAILAAHTLFNQPMVLLLLAVFPLMAVMMVGLRGAFIVTLFTLAVIVYLTKIPWLAPIPGNFQLVLGFSALAMGGIGWGMSNNLVSAIEAAVYHHRLAVQRLEETRQHRAEISVLLREQGKTNYQLDRMNKMLEYARSRAEEAREDRDRFAMAVSHELRSPLNFIIGFSDLIVNSPETYAPVETWPTGLYQDIEGIYRSSTHLLGLINDILDMGKIDAHQMTLLRDRVSIDQVIAEVEGMAETSVTNKGLWLHVDVAKGLPDVYVDRTRIRQVLINLITNALRFTKHGGITIRAKLVDEKTIQVEVQDTGSGIPADEFDRIFDEFRQGGTANWQRTEGSGLGLAISRRFIELHGGEMDVESEVGSGSLFRFTLPVIEPVHVGELGDDEPSKGAKERMPFQPSEKDPLLIFLSANGLWGRLLAETLTGYRVTVIREPQALRKLVQSLYPQAVIVDESLAADDEVQLFCQNPPYDIPIITFTSPLDIGREADLPANVLRYIVKPVNRQVLMETLERIPRARRLLVVDDDPNMIRLVTQLFKAEEMTSGQVLDYELVNAANGLEAFDTLVGGGIDAVLLDLNLPDMDGFSLLDTMQSDERLRDIPVIIISASDIPQSSAVQYKGMVKVDIHRPFTRDELASTILSVLEEVSTVYPGEDDRYVDPR